MTELLKQIAGHLTVMMGSAQPHIEGEEVTGYTIRTGSLHKIIGLLAGAGHPVIVPAIRWTGAPCHGMGGAHRCGDHRCTKDYCAAFGVPTAGPALCNYCGVVVDSGMVCTTDGEFNHCPNKQIGEAIAGVNAPGEGQR